jgi:uncharacterized membrane protein
MTTVVEKSIEVQAPVDAAYENWTQFVQGERHARITEKEPNARVAWTTGGGAENGGVVTFKEVDEGRTKIMLQLEFEPEEIFEEEDDKLGFVTRCAARDLKGFQEYLEGRGRRGTWRVA